MKKILYIFFLISSLSLSAQNCFVHQKSSQNKIEKFHTKLSKYSFYQVKQSLQKIEEKEDDMTGLKWQRVEVTVWTEADYMIDKPQPLWDYARDTFRTSCSVCHSQPDEAHFDANTWPGMFQGMIAFVNMDQDTQALVQKYLQQHSSTFVKKEH